MSRQHRSQQRFKTTVKASAGFAPGGATSSSADTSPVDAPLGATSLSAEVLTSDEPYSDEAHSGPSGPSFASPVEGMNPSYTDDRWLYAFRCTCGQESFITKSAYEKTSKALCYRCFPSLWNCLHWKGEKIGSQRSLCSAVHKALAEFFGKARYHRCRCGAQAHSWAYSNGCDDEYLELVVTPHWSGCRRFSFLPSSYEPLCAECHQAKDEAWRSANKLRLIYYHYLTRTEVVPDYLYA